jgi:hypothetical protein
MGVVRCNQWRPLGDQRSAPGADRDETPPTTDEMAERAKVFYRTPTAVSAGLDSTHSPLVDLSELEIGSIDISIDELFLSFIESQDRTDHQLDYRVFFGLAN